LPVEKPIDWTNIDPGMVMISTAETHSFDYSHPVVETRISQLPKKKSLATLFEVRNKVNDNLQIVGPSGPESSAGSFLTKRQGRCYAHTLAFGALARGMGFPTRAIGGLYDAGSDLKEDEGSHTWNQVYFPEVGWVDIDSTLDDKADGKHTFHDFARRRNRYFITFEGSYDLIDYTNVFTQRGWHRTYRWSSLDRYHRADVSVSTQAKSEPLNALPR